MKDNNEDCSSFYKIWDWRFNCGRHSEYQRPDYYRLKNIYDQLSTIPELRRKEYKEFRNTLGHSLDEMPCEDE